MEPLTASTLSQTGTSTFPLHVASEAERRRQVRGASMLAGFDSMAAVGALLVVLVATNAPAIAGSLDAFLSARITVKNLLLVLLLAAAWPVIFRVFGLYHVRHLRRFSEEARRIAGATAVGTGLAVLIPLTSVSGSIELSDLPYFWAAALASGLLVRGGRRAIVHAGHRRPRRVLIVGAGRLARRVYRDLRADGAQRYEVVGVLDVPGNGTAHGDGFERETTGTLDELETLLMRQVLDEVVIALPVKSCYQEIQHAIAVCERAGVEARYGAALFESTVAHPRYEAHGSQPFVAMQVAPMGPALWVKRGIDIVGAAAGLVALAPLLLFVAVAIKLTSRGPVFFAQERCGTAKRPFRMFKFRSMSVDADRLQAVLEDRNEASGPVFKISEDPRITPLGRFLRKSSIDELPQLWNVLRGEMSLVGPRPLPMRDVHRITRPADMRRFSMRPGLTCLWQISGRSRLSFERWVELDLLYIDTWSLGLDARILLKTLPAVVKGDGAT
jgi:exopolysaccharide biosynthesis polyprenyl glycosylphosphotransferase